MNSLLKRSLLLAAALLVSWLTVPSAAVEPPPPIATASTCAYDSVGRSSSPSHTTTERGPPSHGYATASTYDAVDRLSNGASARPEGATAPLAYTYNDTTQLVQGAGLASTTRWPAEGTAADPSSRARSQVAANTEKWADRGVGRNHPGY